MLAGLARYMDLKQAHPDLAAEARFKQVFGESEAMARTVPALTQHFYDVLEMIGDQLFELAAHVPDGDASVLHHNAMLFVLEAVMRVQQVPSPEIAVFIADGSLSLEEGIKTLPPIPSFEPTATTPREGGPSRPLAEIFAELEERSRECGAQLAIAPMLSAATLHARNPAGGASDVFKAWYEMASLLVGDFDQLHADPNVAYAGLLRTRHADALLYLLEQTTKESKDADIEDRADQIVSGRITLAAALGSLAQ